MTTLGIIGSGNIGSAIARLAVAVDIDVVIANSRGPESLASLVQKLGPNAGAATVEEAAQAADIVLLSIPATAYSALPPGLLNGKTTLDTGNYYPSRDGRIQELDSHQYNQTELNQILLPDALLVKAFSNILAHHIPQLARSVGAPDRSALPIASDHPESLASAADLVHRLGFDTVDAGPVSETWRFEPEAAAFTRIYLADPTVPAEDIMSAPASPTSKDELVRALAAATPVDVAKRVF